MESVILEEDIDENYEPTDAEIYEYARSHGTRQRERRAACGLGS